MQRAQLLVTILSNAIVPTASQAMTVALIWMTVSRQIVKTMQRAWIASMNISVFVGKDSMDLYASMM